MSRRAATLALALALVATGCDPGLDTRYGPSAGRSLNGTSTLAELFRRRGDEVRVARHLTDEIGGWADTIVRFAPYPGPPDSREGSWYLDWLEADADHRLVYVARDYQADVEYWSEVLAALPASSAEDRARASEELERARAEEALLARRPWTSTPLDSEGWFRFVRVEARPEAIGRLEGPWSAGIDPARARLPRRDRLERDDPSGSAVLLSGAGAPLVLESVGFRGRGLMVANGSFLLNGALLNPARRPLAARLAGWTGDGPRRVVFVEGAAPWEPGAEEDEALPSGFSLLKDWPAMQAVVGHLLAFGLLAALAASVRLGRPRPAPGLRAALAASGRLGRPRPAPASGADRPAAHAEAMGDLLARTKDREAARQILAAYRRWRSPSS